MVHLTVILILKEDSVGVFDGNPGQFFKLNVHQSVFAAKLPNLMSTECTTPTVLIQILLFVTRPALIMPA